MAFVDQVSRNAPPFAGALRATAASASTLRLREDEAALRDPEHLACAGRPARRDTAALAADAARGPPAGVALARSLPATRRAEAEILAWWAADVALAERLGWERPVAVAATTLLRPELRAVAPKLRAKGAGRVVALPLADDALSPACAARSARLMPLRQLSPSQPVGIMQWASPSLKCKSTPA
ncbi:DUF1403 family protein [Methylosinus sp. Ce-a6]|uniref:DUF1403 family protein n=1 Tax=Methylosinus sp. Ce-a6 TaxID=2172005 RepID=UPI00135A00DE|nr:DUF1403 family protein [Methylosinus sp. Ce-a6]